MSTSAAVVGMAGYGVAGLLSLLFAGTLVRSGSMSPREGRLPKVFVVANLLTALWAFACMAASAQWIDPRVALALDLARYGSWMGFLLLATRPERNPGREGAFKILSALAAGLLAWGVISQYAFIGVPRRLVEMPAAPMLGLAALGLVLLEQLFRNQGDATRWNAKPVCLALGFVFVFDIYVSSEAILFGAYDDDALAIRGLVHSLSIPLLLVATRRDIQWVRKIQVSRSAAFYSATLLLIGAYLVFISGVGYYVRYFGGDWGRALQLALLFGASLFLAVVLVSGTLRSRLRVFLGKNFFSYRYDYRQEWLRFTGMLSTGSTPQEVGGLVVRGLADLLECPAGSLWSKDLTGDALVQSACWNMPNSQESQSSNSDFCHYLVETEWIIDFDELRAYPGRYGDLMMPQWLSDYPTAWLVVPLIVDRGLIGFVVLARSRATVELNWEVRDLLKTAARQAAGYLAQMHATEALLEARKFDAFNRMSAFVVHDLKNIITQLSLMLKNAQRHAHNPEFQKDMLLTVENSLEKMRQMMVQLREGERPAVGAPSGVELAAILKRLELLARSRDRTLELQVVDRVSTRGHEQRLERVIGHVVQNAFDATQTTGRVWATLSQASGRASVVVGDTGIGMSQEFIQNRLFRPFSSTKQGGMGIGTYESFQYIKELGGSIQVSSELGRGTVVTMLLPLFDHQSRSDLREPPST